MGVQQRPLAMQFVRQVITMEIGHDRRDPAQQRVAYPTVADGAVQWKEEIDEPLGPFHAGLTAAAGGASAERAERSWCIGRARACSDRPRASHRDAPVRR